MKSDAELLQAWADQRVESDFAAFVERHLSFVYNSALRRVGRDPHRAGEIAQRVFIDVARRARALAGHPSVAGWLHVATRNAAINLARTESRQRAREEAAFHMNQQNGPEGDCSWVRLEPVLDAALDELGEADRSAILAHYIDQQGFREIADQLGLSESGARMRVGRALEKLRRILVRHGIESTAAALSIGLGQHAAAAVPAGLGPAVCSAAFAAPPALTLGSVAVLSMTKLKTSFAVAAALAIIASPPLLQLRANHRLQAELAAHMPRPASIAQRRATEPVAAVSEMNAAELDDLAGLRARAALLRARPAGVTEADLKPPGFRGWASPEEALETIQWAFVSGDWRTLAQALTYNAQTKAKADAFFASLAPALRAQFETPERFFGHAWYTASMPNAAYMPQRLCVFATEMVDGPEPVQVQAWGRDAHGRERRTVVRMERGATGWGLGSTQTAQIVSAVVEKMDPQTGLFRPESK